MTEAQLSAIAGEHHVAHKIAMLGLIPTLLHQRMPRLDLLVSSPEGDRTVGLHVRSAANAVREIPGAENQVDAFALRFPLGQRVVATSTANTFFCFVDLRRTMPSAAPDVYIVSAHTVKQEYEGVSVRKYSHLYYERPWSAMQPFRNNWESVQQALRDESERHAIRRPTVVAGFGARLPLQLSAAFNPSPAGR